MLEVNVEELKSILKAKNIREEDFAKAINVHVSTLWRYWKSRGAKMTVGQMHKAVEFIPLSEDQAMNIFLPQFSHKCENIPAKEA